MIQQKRRGTDLLYSLIAEARRYPDSVILGRGDPDFDTPAHILFAAREAMERRTGDYTPLEGILALRQAIAERVKRVNDIDVDPRDEIVVTNGGQEALFLMVLCVIGEGDALVVPEPVYNTYNDALEFVRGEKISVPTYQGDDFRVDPQRVREALTDNTRALLVVSPNNPTASVVGFNDQRELVHLAEEQDLLILADEIYDLFIYDDYVHTSPAALPGGKERTLTLNSFSKAFSMTGWRLGWVVGPADLMARVRELKASITGPTSVVAQYAGLAALTGPQRCVDEMRHAYVRRRRVVLDALDSMGISYGVPQGGQFVFADISSMGVSCIELVARILREQHVLIYPGSAFAPEADWDRYLRITFLQPEEKLRKALDRVKITVDRVVAEGR
jgi:aminotransferase